MNNNYESYLIAEKKSANTIRNYVRNVKECLEFVGKDDKDITVEDLIAYKGSIANQQSATVGLKINSVKNYFAYLKMIHVIDVNPAAELTIPKVKNKVKPYISSEDVTAMLNAAYSARDKAVIAMIATTGCRMEEMATITLAQWNKMKEYNERNITILGKGDKERSIYINDMTFSYVEDYLARRNDDDNPYLFGSYRGNKIANNNLNGMLKNTAKRAGLIYWEDVTAHSLRHAFATIANKNGVSVAVISAALGHSSLAVTSRYIHSAQEDIDAAMKGMIF